MKLKLIPEWKDAWKFISVQLASLLVFLDVAYEYLPAVQAYFPEGWVKWVALAIVLGRIVKQRHPELQQEPQNGSARTG